MIELPSSGVPRPRASSRAGSLGNKGREVSVVDDSSRLETEGKWDQLRGRVKEAWGALTDDELDQTEGKRDRLVGLIKERTGESADAVERKLRDMLDHL
jgi:uncharacterized protein YjbJ (UPF0337 family)